MLLETRAISSSQHSNTHKHIQSSALLGYNITNKTKQPKITNYYQTSNLLYTVKVGLRKKGKKLNSQRKQNTLTHTHRRHCFFLSTQSNCATKRATHTLTREQTNSFKTVPHFFVHELLPNGVSKTKTNKQTNQFGQARIPAQRRSKN